MKNIVTIIALLLAGTVNAQDTLKLSLSETIKHSLSNNKTIQAEELNDQLNEYKTKELNSAFYPIISANAGITHYVDVPQQYVAASALSSTAPSDQYVRLELLLPNSFNVGISANWTLYNQGVYSARKILSAQTQLSDIQFEKSKSELAFSVSQLYYGIVFLQKQQESLFKIDANSDKLIDILQRNYENGTIKRSDLEKAQVSKVNVTSQIVGLKTAVETQIKLLKLMIGIPAYTVLHLTETDFRESLIPLSTSTSGIETSFDFQLMQIQVKLSELERKSIQASYLPTLALTYSYSYNTVSPEFGEVLNSSFSYPMQFVGINLSVPIFDGNRNLSKLKQNAVKSGQLALQSQFVSEKIDVEIANALLQYNSNLTTLASNEANTKLAQKLFDQSILEYQQGTVFINDVLLAENSLHQALTAYFNSVSSALVALLEYKKATNTILNK